MKPTILMAAVLYAAAAHADVLEPPITTIEWNPIWVSERLAPEVDFMGDSTFYYEGRFSSPPFVAAISPLGTFSYVGGLLSWNTPDFFSLWVFKIDPNGDVDIFKIRHRYQHGGSVQIGDSPNLSIYGKADVPDGDPAAILLIIPALVCLILFR